MTNHPHLNPTGWYPEPKKVTYPRRLQAARKRAVELFNEYTAACQTFGYESEPANEKFVVWLEFYSALRREEREFEERPEQAWADEEARDQARTIEDLRGG